MQGGHEYMSECRVEGMGWGGNGCRGGVRVCERVLGGKKEGCD